MPRRDATDRLSHEQLLVHRSQRRTMRRRDLVLAVPELRVVLLDPDLLLLQRRDQLVQVVLRRGRADRREAEPRVDRHVLPVYARRERELVLERGFELRTALS